MQTLQLMVALATQTLNSDPEIMTELLKTAADFRLPDIASSVADAMYGHRAQDIVELLVSNLLPCMLYCWLFHELAAAAILTSGN